MTDELKDCPFCGGNPELITNQDGNIQQVRCPVCGAHNFWGINAKELWNRRTRKDTSLKPCPVCGHKGSVYYAFDAVCVQCFHCGLTTNDFDTPEEAIAVWNWRHDDYV